MTLTRSGSSFATSGLLKYDVWGGIRSGTPQGPNRYCANLGHKQDDESGLIYMRARYYEPGSGRFVSEDPALDGSNWYVYTNNIPSCYRDGTGKESLGEECSAESISSTLDGLQGQVAGAGELCNVQMAGVSASFEDGALILRIDKATKLIYGLSDKASVNYALLVRFINYITLRGGASCAAVMGYITSPGGSEFFTRLCEEAMESGEAYMCHDGPAVWIYWLIQ